MNRGAFVAGCLALIVAFFTLGYLVNGWCDAELVRYYSGQRTVCWGQMDAELPVVYPDGVYGE